jgi:NADH-quinone oxidoreductase subunit J
MFLNIDIILEEFTLPYFSVKQIIFIIFVSFVLLIAFFIILSRDVIYCLLGLIFLYVLCAILVLSYFLEFLAFSLIIVSLGAVAVLFLYVVLMVNLKGYEIRESIFYKFNVSSFLMSLLFLVITIFMTRDDIQASYILDKVNHTEDEYGIPIVRYINVFDVIYRSFNSPLKLYGIIILYDKFFIFFVLIGVLLLVALIGCILLTYDFIFKKKK